MTGKNLAYLVNQYPSPTHTFIWREIAALEALGIPVERYAIRRDTSGATQAGRTEEAARVRAVLDTPAWSLLVTAARRVATDPRRFVGALVAAVRLGWRSSRGVPLHLVYLLEACVLAEWMDDAGIDHVHVHFGTNATAVALLCHRLGGPTYSFTTHGPEEFDRPRELKLADKVAEARFVVGISDFGRSQLYRWSDPRHWDRVHVVRCGVDDAYLHRTPVPVPDVTRFISIGRLSPQKGQVLLVQAVGRLLEQGRDVELVLVGDGELRPEVEAAIADTGRPEAFELTGWVDNARVEEELLASRALVLPSFAEGLPVVIMEALALGRPVITTSIAGIPELVVPGRNGWLVPAGSIERLVEAMGECLDLPIAELDRMGQDGAGRVRARHDSRSEAAVLAGLITG